VATNIDFFFKAFQVVELNPILNSSTKLNTCSCQSSILKVRFTMPLCSVGKLTPSW